MPADLLHRPEPPATPLAHSEGQMCDLLGGISRRTLQSWRASGIGPPFVKLNGRVLYPRDLALAWLAENASNAADASDPRPTPAGEGGAE